MSVAGLLRELGARRVARRALHALEARAARPARPPAPISHPTRAEWLAGHPLSHLRALGDLAGSGAWADWMRARLDDAQLAEVSARADAAARSRVLAYGHLQLDFGEPPDWRLSPADGSRWPADTPHQRVLRGAAPGVDIKDTWEFGRAGHLLHLCRAHALAPSARWPRAYARHVEGFAAANPFGLGVHWASGQEVAIRALVWLFVSGPLGPPEDFGGWMRALRLHAAHLDANLGFARWAVPNNHLIAEATALAVLGHVLGHAPEAARWRGRGVAALREALRLQFLPDGGYCQLSHTYHRHALGLLLFARAWLGDLEPGLRPEIDAILARSGAHLASFALGGGARVPNHGHNDGAQVLQWAGAGVLDFRPILQVSRLASSGARQLPPGPWDEAALLWLGPDALAAPRAPFTTRDRFPDTGYAILRDPAGDAVLRDGAPTRGFGQSDMLHVTFARGGLPWLLDAGSGRYNGDLERHARFVGQAGHDAPTDRGAPWARRVGAFTWIEAPEITRAHAPGLLSASARASANLEVTRSVTREASGWRVVDELTASAPTEVWTRWLVPAADWSATLEDGVAIFEASSVRGERARVEVTCGGGVRLESCAARRGDYAPRYADFAEATALTLVARAEGDGRIITRFRF